MRVLLADDQPGVRSALRLVLEQESDGKTEVWEAGDVQGLLATAQAVRPALVLLDQELPGEGSARGFPPVRSLMLTLLVLRRLCPEAKLVVLGAHGEACQSALVAGADLFIGKGDSPDHLLKVLRAVIAERKRDVKSVAPTPARLRRALGALKVCARGSAQATWR